MVLTKSFHVSFLDPWTPATGTGPGIVSFWGGAVWNLAERNEGRMPDLERAPRELLASLPPSAIFRCVFSPFSPPYTCSLTWGGDG